MKRIFSLFLTVCALFTLSPAAAAHNFSDVPPDAWYSGYVDYVTQRGIFNGTSSTSFSPASNMTRGMFVTALGRYAGVTVTESGLSGIITKDSVNMRAEPNIDSNIVAVFDKNMTVQIKGVTANWYHVH